MPECTGMSFPVGARIAMYSDKATGLTTSGGIVFSALYHVQTNCETHTTAHPLCITEIFPRDIVAGA